ncbi:hypothetical protein D6D06_00910 [Aureobasidium pullulans]|nr:hypothetical protein D6D06_00910 [Aureobasidium pullulans]
MPVVGVLSLARRAQHVTRSPHVRSCPIGNNARRFIDNSVHRSFSQSTHLKSDYLPADEQGSFLRNIVTDSSQTRHVARHWFQPHQDKVEYRPWHLSLSPKHGALKAILDQRLQRLAESESSNVTTLPQTAQDEEAIQSLGYEQDRVDYYTNILSSKDSLFAARLLTSAHAPPFFVYKDFLARPHIRPEALRLLLDYLPAWEAGDLLDGRLPNLVYCVFESLLHHCRRVWPNAMPVMATYLTQHLCLSDKDLLHIQENGTAPESISRLTSQYNNALRLLARPSHISPFKNSGFQEAAQAIILRHMADHTPPLVINRLGYRAVARVQLAAKKTPQEQEWARLKSPSWPPWKEDRTGMDAHIGLEYGVSRAHQILLRMQEAGYPMKDWEQVAMIYAGWDTDRSPTIQKRIFLDDLPKAKLITNLWIARIKTTRTTQQAWACFLAYQDEHLPSNDRIYHAMFEVLIQERKRNMMGSENIGHEIDDDGASPLHPGDTQEIGSPPSSAHQLTYIRAEIPSIQQLYDHMREDGEALSDDTLTMLLESAESLQEGLAYLETGAQRYRIAVTALLHGSKDYQALHVLPDHLFTAYVRLLCRFPHTPLDTELKLQWRYGSIIKTNFDLRQPLARALNLLVQQKRTYRPAWNSIFKALARRTAPTLASSWRSLHIRGEESLRLENELYDKIFAFNLARQVTETMWENDITLDEDALSSLCIVTEHAASAVHAVFREYGHKQEYASEATARLITHANGVFQEGPDWMKERFWTLVEGAKDARSPESQKRNSKVKLPTLYTIPRPALLHAYIRALGLLRDYNGLEELVHWMTEHRAELAERRAMDRRGDILMRRALTALRVFLEDKWEPSRPGEEEGEFVSVALPEQVEDIATMVDGVEDWGGWPSEEDATMYVERGHDVW